jgi:CHAT domain-containing protein
MASSEQHVLRKAFEQNIEEAHRYFEELLIPALAKNDLPRVNELAASVESLSFIPPYLCQWCTYARGILATETGQAYVAIHTLEALRQIGKDEMAQHLWARVLNSLGIAYDMNEQWDKAQDLYLQSLDFCEQQDDSQGAARVLNNLVAIYEKSGEFTRALECAQRSVGLWSNQPETAINRIKLGKAWNELGIVYKSIGDLAQARDVLEHSLQLAVKWDNKNGEGTTRHNLGETYHALKMYVEAQIYYQQAFEILKDTGNLHLAADSLHCAARCRMLAGDVSPEVLLQLDYALQRAEQAHNLEIITDILLTRAELHQRAGDTAEAIADTRRAVQHAESLQSNIVQSDEMAKFMASRSSAYDAMVNRLYQSGETGYAEAFRYVEMAKSRTLVDMLGGRFEVRSSDKVPPELLERETNLRRELSELYQSNDEAPGTVQAIEKLENELGEVRERIRLRDAEYSSFKGVQPLSLAEAQSRLPEGALLLEYFIADDDILAFSVTAGQFRMTRLPLQVKDLKRAFTSLGDEQLGMLRNLTPAADGRLYSPYLLKNLYQKLVKLFAAELDAARLLCIVPHGMLHYLPFHAFFYEDKDGGKCYLSEMGAQPRPILYAPSATVLLDYCQNKPVSTQSGCLAIGYNHQALTQAELEAQAVVQIMGGKAVLGSDATRTVLPAEGAGYRFIHLSCHGDFHASRPTLSNLSLADGNLDVVDVLRDCRLNAELVCLSACETGRHSILRGDELIGLTRAFLYAGSPAVIVSHWRVDEFPTRRLMEYFYQALSGLSTQSGGTALALAQAQQALRSLTVADLRAEGAAIHAALQRIALAQGVESAEVLKGDVHPFEHPFYWAPFFLMGDRLR